MATLCPKVPNDEVRTDPPPCHWERVLNDGMLHRCRLNASHDGDHLCYTGCNKEWR